MTEKTPYPYRKELFLAYVMKSKGVDAMIRVEGQRPDKLRRDVDAWWETEKYAQEARDLQILALFEEYGIANDHYREILTRGY